MKQVALFKAIPMSTYENQNESAFVGVFDEFAPKIYRFAYFRTGSKDIAEDISSQTFLKAWEYLRAGNEIRSYPVFLYRVARNLLADHWRDKNNVLKRLDDETAVKLVDIKNSPEKILEENDLKLVISAMEKLPGEQKDILHLRFVDGLGAGEIAKLIGKKRGAVYVSIFRSLKVLKEHFNNIKSETQKYV